MPPPSSGGLILGLMFNMLEEITLDKNEPLSADNILKISEIMQIAYSLRSVYLADSDFYEVPSENFLDKAIAKKLLKNINLESSSSIEDFYPIKFKFK